MSGIDLATVRHVAKLARLRLDGDAAERMVAELSRIVEYVDVLERLDDVPSRCKDSASATPLRSDEVRNEPAAEALLDGVPDRSGTHIRVPAVIQGGT